MNATRLLRAAAAAALIALPQTGWTVFDPVNDDTDIFLANPSFNSTRPNVLIFLDNTSNWNASSGAAGCPGSGSVFCTKYGGVKAGLSSIVAGLTDAYNVGLGLFVETGSPNNNTSGAYMRYGVRQMTTGNKDQLVNMIAGLDNNGDKGNNADYSLAMMEMYNYFAGVTTYAGHGKTKADAGGSIYFPAGRVAHANSPVAAGALPANGGTTQTYVSPITDACQKNFIIVISNGTANDQPGDLTTVQNKLTSIAGAAPGTIPITPNHEQGIWADEFAKFMANSDCNQSFAGVQNVITYTIDIVPGSTGNGPDHSALLKSMALNGKGKYFPITDMSSSAQLENALKSIFSEVQAVNSVFASTTLPVSVNVRGTNLNQVYIGVFRPDSNKAPRWLGNLKLYKLGVDSATQNLFLADATGLPAENASTGFISTTATSFWSVPSCYWQFRGTDPNSNATVPTTCDPATISSAYPYWSDSPDGNLVEKGGAAQKQRTAFPSSNAARNLYTCVDGTGLCASGALLSDSPFNTGNVTAADVGAYTTYGISTINWDSLTSTATVVLGAAPSPVWSSGDTVRVSGVTPTVFNGDYTVTKIDAVTYTFPLSPGPDATRGRIHAAGHLLSAGDYVYVYDGTACPSAYTSFTPDCLVPTSYVRPITRVDNDNFDYDLNGTAGPALTQYQFSAYGLRLISSVRGLIGGSTELVTIPGHGYGAAGTVIKDPDGITDSCIYIGDATLTFEWYSSYCNRATVVDADTISIAVQAGTIQAALGATSNTAQVTVPAHVFSTGQTVTITGSTQGYNGAQNITRLDGNTVSFASALTTADAGAGMRMGAVISTITHPTSGANGCGSTSGRDTATVTTATAHNFTAGQTINIFGTGTFNTATSTFTGYDSTWVVQSAPTSTTFTIFNACIDQVASSLSPAAGLAGFTVTNISPLTSTTTSNTGKPIYLWRYMPWADSDRPLSSGSGIMAAGRPTDSNDSVRDVIVAWARSTDNKDDENLNSLLTDVRASTHGDVLHSRPATINYNRYGDDNDIYAYYGSNDGILHAVKGGIAQHASGADSTLVPGTERWGFIPREFFPKLKRLRDQLPTISNLNQKDYFFDGSIGVYLKDAPGSRSAAAPSTSAPTTTCPSDTANCGVIGDNTHATAGDRVNLYLTMRRGGDFMYSLNVLNPATPKLAWRKGNGDTGWGQVGQTWSEPKISRATASLGNASNPDNVIVIFGAGYDDKVEDINPCLIAEWYTNQIVPKAIGNGVVTYTASGSCTITGGPGGNGTAVNRTLGRGLMVVDAISGDVIWRAGASPAGAAHNLTVPGMTCAIASDVTVLDKDRNGFADRLYVGDTCGNVWRADISDPSIDRWSVTKIASLSGTSATNITDKRKFLFPPDLVFATDSGGNYTAVLLGSGDREHPFDSTVQNAFYMIKDRDSSDALVGAANNTTVSIAAAADGSLAAPFTAGDLFDATNSNVDTSTASSNNGWFVSLAAGEKVVGSAVTIAGTTFFNTNQPSGTAGGGACGSNLGIAREYLVGFADASATVDLNGLGTLSIANRSTIHAGGGYLPSPVPVVVEIDGKKYQAVISGTSVQTPPGLTLEKRTRSFWYKQID